MFEGYARCPLISFQTAILTVASDRTVRTYLFPELTPQHVLNAHRAAVNAVSISHNHIISVSGDRSLRLWDADTGALLRTFENHHRRGYAIAIPLFSMPVRCPTLAGRRRLQYPARRVPLTCAPLAHSIASIDYKHPFVLSGSSDKHIRLLDVSTLQGWSTSPTAESKASVAAGLGRSVVCDACGSSTSAGEPVQPPLRRRPHEDLVRSVALSSDLVVSGSYDFTVKVSACSTLSDRPQRSCRAHPVRALVGVGS